MEKYIKGFDERYIAKDNGEIFDNKYNRPVCQWTDNVGYKQCILFKNGKRNYKRVHRIIAETLLPNPLNQKQINHINGNKKDNRLENLEWIDNSKNTQHAYDNNLYKFKKRAYPINVYDLEGVFIKQFPSIRQTAEQLNLNRKTISAILNKEKANNYPYIFEYADESVETIESITLKKN